ncbi:hypothetical protein JI721_14565 [Alicyclobacillus cycloheptanicus]|uniref:DUF3892 domain-containing protein n=1 Tax=Alicyclobacillus cycloheptanicus TaxID=1457 RepID=A0ABT9XNA2_9BACL|nr:hypothetical protein [Alicyclobacillus cycloheptanicus]MDQ0191615.1 hypothetical protein [Alicyclobacillus cycloheptanicus]WDM00892.1 hypothetical protein JI721_14565 [Alicyclobacillus cycloheptanicus]
MGTKFVRVRKNWRGEITHLLTNDGQVVSIQEARRMAMNGEVDSLTDVHADGTWEIDATAGTSQYAEGANLDELPEF